MRHWLGIWWSGSKDLFSQFDWAKWGHVSKAFFGKINSLKIKHLKKIHFLVPEYDNLIGVKTHRDKLENSREGTLEKRVQIFGFGKGRRPYRGFGYYPVITFSFVCLLRPWDFRNFLVSALDRPFQVFTLESHFFIFFFFLHFFIVLLCTWKFKIYPKQVNILSRWFWLNNRDNSLIGYENFSRKNLFSPSIHIRSKWTFRVCNVGLDSGFRKEG